MQTALIEVRKRLMKSAAFCLQVINESKRLRETFFADYELTVMRSMTRMIKVTGNKERDM